jgi:hypothetical protein
LAFDGFVFVLASFGQQQYTREKPEKDTEFKKKLREMMQKLNKCDLKSTLNASDKNC